MSETICVIVVTYNRKDLLLKCINGIFNQSKFFNVLYIVDNNSTDGTYKLLIDNKIINKIKNNNRSEKKIKLKGREIKTVYFKLDKNLGSAGGFHFGIAEALKEKYDWYWMMDDDVEPLPNTLESLLEYKNISKCIHPVHINEDGTEYYEHIQAKKNRTNNEYFINSNSCTFEGMLIHRSILENVGLPDKNFFIVHDDKEFGIRVRKFTPIVYVDKAKLKKLLPGKFIKNKFRIREEFSTWKIYYQVRNLFIIRKKHSSEGITFTEMTYLIIKRIASIILYNNNKLIALRNVFYGCYDGILGNFGKTNRKIK